MFDFPPFVSGASAFSADEVFCGVALVQPTYGHAASLEAAKVRSHNFRMALHPYTMHILDNAAHGSGPTTADFKACAMSKMKDMLDFTDTVARAQQWAEKYSPILAGKRWSLFKDSFLIKALEPWVEANALIVAINKFMDESGLMDPALDPTHAELKDLDFCRQQYGQMVTDFAKLVELIKTELMKVQVFVVSVCSYIGPFASNNEVMLYEGDAAELERILSVALPRSEAAQFPAVAFTKSIDGAKPLTVTFKTGNFAVLDWSMANPTWFAKAADLTSSFGDVLRTTGKESWSHQFNNAGRIYIIQLRATQQILQTPTWRNRGPHKALKRKDRQQ